MGKYDMVDVEGQSWLEILTRLRLQRDKLKQFVTLDHFIQQ